MKAYNGVESGKRKILIADDEFIRENGLTTEDLYLEIAESAYVRDSSEIVNVVNELQEHGFFIEMDDFFASKYVLDEA